MPTPKIAFTSFIRTTFEVNSLSKNTANAQHINIINRLNVSWSVLIRVFRINGKLFVTLEPRSWSDQWQAILLGNHAFLSQREPSITRPPLNLSAMKRFFDLFTSWLRKRVLSDEAWLKFLCLLTDVWWYWVSFLLLHSCLNIFV